MPHLTAFDMTDQFIAYSAYAGINKEEHMAVAYMLNTVLDEQLEYVLPELRYTILSEGMDGVH